MIEHVDPFIGSAATDLPEPEGLAATWWWPKPQVGNTHPGATYPFGMVSACAYSGGYPTGYGPYQLNTEGAARPRLHDRHRSPPASPTSSSPAPGRSASTTTTSGSPRCCEPLDALGADLGPDRRARRAGLLRRHPRLGHPLRDHRRPQERGAPLHLPRPPGRPAGRSTSRRAGWPSRTARPSRCAPTCESLAPGVAQGEIVVEGTPLSVHVECDAGDWRQMLWYDRRLMPGGTRLDFDRIRPTTLRPFGLMWRGPTEPGQVLELRFGFSLRGVEQATGEPARRLRHARRRRTLRRSRAAAPTTPHAPGGEHLHHGRQIDTPSPGTPRRSSTTALYHSMIKPCFAYGESPFWLDRRPVRLRHLHHVGHLPHPAAADHRAVPRIGRPSWPTRC